MIISKKNKLILITPPKTGTHSITNYIVSSGIKPDNPKVSVNYPIYHLMLSEICIVYDIPIDSINEYKVIQCVRNPYNRMVSAWLQQQKILNKNISFLDLLNKVKKYKHLLPKKIDEFYISFYGTIKHKYDSFERGNWGGLRFYFEQNWFNDLNTKVRYYKLEDLSESTKELSDFLNIGQSKFPHINKNLKRNSHNDYKNSYTELEKKLVDFMYEKDIEMFNYEF